MERRAFIKYAGTFSILAGTGLISCSEDDGPQPNLGSGLEIDLSVSPFDRLQQPGSWVLHPDINVIMVNFEGTIRAFTSVCTHSQCSRNWVFGTTQATCTCHGSKFDYEGKLIQGPARQDLERFNVAINGNSLTITN